MYLIPATNIIIQQKAQKSDRKEITMYERKFVRQRAVLPEKYPFTQWHAYGSPAYGIVPTDPLVEFVDQETGRRTVIIDEKRRIVNFPGIEKEDEIRELLGEGSTIKTMKIHEYTLKIS